MGFWDAVASAEAYANNLHLATDITTSTPHHSIFYRPDALHDTQPTVSNHWRHNCITWITDNKKSNDKHVEPESEQRSVVGHVSLECLMTKPSVHSEHQSTVISSLLPAHTPIQLIIIHCFLLSSLALAFECWYKEAMWFAQKSSGGCRKNDTKDSILQSWISVGYHNTKDTCSLKTCATPLKTFSFGINTEEWGRTEKVTCSP